MGGINFICFLAVPVKAYLVYYAPLSALVITSVLHFTEVFWSDPSVFTSTDLVGYTGWDFLCLASVGARGDSGF